MALSFLTRFAQDATTETVPTEIPTTEISPELQNQINEQLNSIPDVSTTSADTGILAGIGLMFMIFYLVILVFYLICAIKIFQKAGRKWWEAIIPIYNIFIMLKIVGRPAWWILLFFIPLVNIVVSVILAIDLAKAFEKDEVFGILLLWLLSFVGYPILAFGSAKYVGPLSSSDTGSNEPPTQPPAEGPATPPANTQQNPPTNLVQ